MDKTYADNSSIKDLVVIDLPHSDRVKVNDWEWKQHFFPAENCDRQLLIGFADDLQHVPKALRDTADDNPRHYSDKQPIIARGADAYKHLLRVACGMLDKRPGEKETFENIRANWNAFIQPAEDNQHQERRERFGRIVQDFMDDSSTIRGQVFQNREAGFFLQAVSTEPAVAARNLIHPGKHKNILIIAEKEGITTNTFKVLDNCADVLYITHPDQKMCEGYANRFRQMGYKSTIEIVPYEEAMQGELPNDIQIVFNCQPMDNGDKDRTFIEGWQKNTDRGLALVHLKGNPLMRNATSDIWKASRLENVFFIENIQAQKERDRLHNSKILEHAETAITNCATSRCFGRRPIYAINKDTAITHLLDFPIHYEGLVQQAAERADQFKRNPVKSRQQDTGSSLYR